MNRHARRLALLLTTVPLVFVAAGAGAQQRVGDTELGFSFDLDDVTAGGESQLSATLRFGKYLTDRFELGLEMSAFGPLEDTGDVVLFRLFAVYELNPGATSVWYARGGYFALLDAAGDGFADLGLGVKSYVRDDTALYWETVYGVAFLGAARGDNVRTVTGVVCTF
jgi:hypothetical protein